MKNVVGLPGKMLCLSVCLWIAVACGDDEDSAYCDARETGTCYCPDGTSKEQSCKADRSGWEPCDCVLYGVWCDEASGLCWQDPQKDAYNEEDIGIVSKDAVRYCEELAFGGYDDWTLPDIDQLRTLLRGNPPNEAGGACEVTVGASTEEIDGCVMLEEYGGPGAGACYWPEALTGTCNKPDPAAIGHPLEYWSSTPASDKPDDWVAFVSFDNAAVGFNHSRSFADVRCVRPAPTPVPACGDPDATCAPGETSPCDCSDTRTGARRCAEAGCFGPCECTAFTPTENQVDMCPTCDQFELTIRVPEKLDHAPYQLAAFFFAEDSFPPAGPPEGGNSDMQISNPDIDLGKPYRLTVPACTYYRDRCLSGPHNLWIGLIMSEKTFPMPEAGDYVWGLDADPILVNAGEQRTVKMDIELVPVLAGP